jgi:enoyl-CoA hydratase/carnithine racemase
MAYQNIRFKVVGDVGILTLHDPERLNALNQDMLNEIHQVLGEIRSQSPIRALVLTGAGRAFSAGGDIRLMERRFEESPPAARNRIRNFHSVILSFRNLDIPVIGSINGAAIGAGCSLALACDLRIASVKAKFGIPHAKLGIPPDGGGTHLLTRLVGTARALELLLSGDTIDAERAKEIGLVNRLVAQEELEKASTEWATQLSKGPPYAMQIIKSTVYKCFEMSLATELDVEALAVPVCLSSEDHREGVKAFLEKRSPHFTGK